jgi:hypothetical protein
MTVNTEQKTAYEWAKNQNYTSVAARYAKVLAEVVDEKDAENERLKQTQKGCEYCTDLSRYKGFGYAEFFHQTAPDETYEIGIEVKFCPNCGRKLDGEKDG